MIKKSCLALFLLVSVTVGAFAAEWTVKDDVNTVEDARVTPPGRKVDVLLDGKLVARFVYGEGQIKPFLNVFSDEGDCLTQWDPKQDLPHHRGIYIGWNKISSDLGGPVKAPAKPKKGEAAPAPTPAPAAGTIDPKGTFDLWHMNNGGKMEVVKIEKAEGGADSGTIVATIAWHAGNKDASGSDLLLTETRTMKISRPEAKKTVVDLKFDLKAARDLTLGGDLQHAGMHFRGSEEILKSKIQNDKAKKGAITADYETAYVWEPTDKIKGDDLKWARLMFHIGTHWYSATHMNAPSNPVEELSMRGYGRFGFFFKKDLKKDEVLPLTYRIVTESEKSLKAIPTAEEKTAEKTDGAALYDDFAKSVAK